jgi:hypothetical protein
LQNTIPSTTLSSYFPALLSPAPTLKVPLPIRDGVRLYKAAAVQSLRQHFAAHRYFNAKIVGSLYIDAIALPPTNPQVAEIRKISSQGMLFAKSKSSRWR